MATEKSASQILLAGGLAGTAGYGLYRNSQAKKYRPGQKKSLVQSYGGFAAAGLAGYLGYKLDRSRGGSGAKGAAIGAGGFLAMQKLGVGKSLGVAALAGAGYLAFKAMPASTKANIKNSPIGKQLTEGYTKLKNTVTSRGNIQRAIGGFLKNESRYRSNQFVKGAIAGALGGGPTANAFGQQIAQFVTPTIRDTAFDLAKQIPTGKGSKLGDKVEEFKNPRLKTVEKMKQSGQIDKLAKEQGKDPSKMYDSMKKGAKDKGYVQEALGNTKEHRQYLGGINKERRDIDKQLKAGNLDPKKTQELKERKRDLEKGKIAYSDKVNKKAAKIREKGILGIEKSDSEQTKAQKRAEKSNELLDSSNYVSRKQKIIDKKKAELVASGKIPKEPKPPKVPAEKKPKTSKKDKKMAKEAKIQQKKMKAAQTTKPSKKVKPVKSSFTATGSSLAKRPKLAPMKAPKMKF